MNPEEQRTRVMPFAAALDSHKNSNRVISVLGEYLWQYYHLHNSGGEKNLLDPSYRSFTM
jgi:hypothetical protein